MALNYELIKRTTNTQTGDVIHSTGYANAQNGGNFGAATGAGMSFQERLELEKNRKVVQSYKQAGVAQQRNFMPKAMNVEEAALAKAQKAIEAAGGGYSSRQEMNSKLNAGGLRKYDKSATNINAAAEVSKTRGFGRVSAAEGRAAAADYRAAQAQRFSGGVKTFQGGPKTFGGGAGITPRSGR